MHQRVSHKKTLTRPDAIFKGVRQLSLIVSVFWPVFSYLIGDIFGAVVMLLALPIFYLSRFLAEYRGDTRPGLHLIATTTIVVLIAQVENQGGLYSPALWWTVLVPSVLISAGSYRAAVLSLVTIAIVVAILVAKQTGMPIVMANRGSWPELFQGVYALSFVAVNTAYLYVSELDRRSALADLKRRNAELILARDQALAATHAKARFLANMSHEIRTPLNGVIGTGELLGLTTLTSEQRRLLEIMTRSGNGLLTIINDVLDYSKLEAQKVELENRIFNVHELIEGAAELFAPRAVERHITLTCRVAADMPNTLIGDAARISQILNNLLSNAIKFTQVGGVDIDACMLIDQETAQSQLRVIVSDTGVGISAITLPQLGKAFSQADVSTTRVFGGTGLGLSICRELLALMGGSLNIDSELQRGTRVTCLLPLAITRSAPLDELSTAPPPRDANHNEAVTAAVTGAHVLLVEDNPINSELIQAMLGLFDCTVVVAQDGSRGVQCWHDDLYDLVFMDCQMPVMDGYGATRAIRAAEATQRRARTAIVGLTANALAGDRQLCLEAGMDDHLAKPCTIEQLGNMLTKHLSTRQRSASHSSDQRRAS